MKSDRLGHASPSKGGLSGQNDDSSVVSLKALVAKADPTLSATRAPSVDDSGIIDLKKLMASAPPSSDALPPVLAPSEAGLFAVPENTPLPHVMQTPGLTEDATENPSSRRGTVLVSAMLMMGAAIVLAGALYLKASRVAPAQRGVAAAVPVQTSEPRPFVEAPRPMETAPAMANVAPTPKETKAGDVAPRRGRQAAVKRPSRERAQQESTPQTRAGQKPAASESCDLMCEIERRARKTKK